MNVVALRLASLAALLGPALGCDPDLSVEMDLECSGFGVESPILRVSGSAYAPDNGILHVVIAGDGAGLAAAWCDDWEVAPASDGVVCSQSPTAIEGEIEWEVIWVVEDRLEYSVTATLSDGDYFEIGQWDTAEIACDS